LCIGSRAYIEMCKVWKRLLCCSFIYYSPEVNENVMLSLYIAWRHVEEGGRAPLILNFDYETGCSGSYPGCFTTCHLTNIPPTPFGHCVASTLGPRSILNSVYYVYLLSLRQLSHNPKLVQPASWSVERLSYYPSVWRHWRHDMQCACFVTLSPFLLTIVEVAKE
jgi:hypothetical protein